MGKPDFLELGEPENDWDYTVYGNEREIIPDDAPDPLGKEVTLTSWYDANLLHDMPLGKAVTGIIHYFNGTPIEAFLKKQAKVETAIYGAEFLAVRKCLEQVVGLRNYLHYLGVPIT